MSGERARVGELDVIGLGALNIDYIAGASRLSELHAEKIRELTERFDWNIEGPATEERVQEVINQLGMASLETSLGGSAWNTVFTLANMDVKVRLGYVGVLGREETPGLSFIRQMELLGIDHRWVARRPDRPCGTCLSYIDDIERVLMTHPGVNLEVRGHLRDNREAIAAYLASARVVHVTSFLDDDTPAEVLGVLDRTKEINPRVLISFDPGHAWAVGSTAIAPVAGILRHSGLLFVNYREFKALGGYAAGERDEQIARKVLDRCGSGCLVIVTKTYDLVEVFRAAPDGVRMEKFTGPSTVREADVEDATGVGDVFAAAVLAARVSRSLLVELGSALALNLAHERNGRPPRTEPVGVSGLYATPRLPIALPPKGKRSTGPSVCVVHDADPQIDQLRMFLEHDCGLTVCEHDSTAGAESAMEEFGKESPGGWGFAICLFRGRDSMEDGRVRATQRVVYFAGLFHGRYGYERVAVLVEDGCEMFSNLAGLVRLDFPPGRLDGTFLQLQRMLRREGLATRGGR